MVQGYSRLPNASEWRIYYDDGRTIGHEAGLPSTTDDHLGVIVIAQRRFDGRYHTVYGAEYYLFEGCFWVPVGLNGLEDWTMNLLPKIKCVLKGRAIPHGYYNDIFTKAKETVRKGDLG